MVEQDLTEHELLAQSPKEKPSRAMVWRVHPIKPASMKNNYITKNMLISIPMNLITFFFMGLIGIEPIPSHKHVNHYTTTYTNTHNNSIIYFNLQRSLFRFAKHKSDAARYANCAKGINRDVWPKIVEKWLDSKWQVNIIIFFKVLLGLLC